MPAILEKIEKEYIVHLDEKNRFAIRGAKTKHWHVQVLRGGHMLVSPQKLVDDPPISAETLTQIKRSIGNFKAGKVSGPIDIKAARRALRS
jgi:hypothetical protein